MANGNIGAKYQSNDGKIYRSIRYKNSDTIVLKDLETGLDCIMPISKLTNDFIKLTPDAILNLMLTKYESGENDVYAVIYKTTSIAAGSTEPDLILRQDIYSYMKNPFAMDGKIYVGDCITKYTLPDGDTKMMDLFEFSEVEHDVSFDLYSDDTLDDIISIIGRKSKPFDDTLKYLHDERTQNGLIIGYCNSLKELMEDNHFIDAYRTLFNIMPIDWPIILDEETSFNKDGDIILTSKQHKALEDLLRKNITDVKILEYDYDIDISEIIKYSHILVSDSNQKIYLIAYTVISDYPIDDDILKAMKVN